MNQLVQMPSFHSTHSKYSRKTAGERENILFIDDEASIVKMSKKALEKHGYTVTGKICSLEALKSFLAAPGEFDLVVTDIAMPQMTGNQLALELMKVRSDIPIILCSGHSRKSMEEQYAGIKIKAFLCKPFSIMELTETVRMALNKD
jgi:DNA-binding NtrC family response regulator